ncbi:MAG: hypothetical protein LUD47_03330 [Clostridia bacterium]|nr:hypothetical protein [Clostridia bacterium]
MINCKIELDKDEAAIQREGFASVEIEGSASLLVAEVISMCTIIYKGLTEKGEADTAEAFKDLLTYYGKKKRLIMKIEDETQKE